MTWPPRRAARVLAALGAVALGAAQGAPPKQAAASSAATVTDPRAADPALDRVRLPVLHEAEAALARGDTAAAQAGFDRAAGMLHAPDTEMGLVRTAMQAGDYRRALAFCAHTAGAHLEAPAASALYAWLLAIGGQEVYARRVLAQAAPRAGGDAVFAAAERAFAAPVPRADGPLLQPPSRFAPLPLVLGGQAPPAAARHAGAGVLLDAAHALVPTSAVGAATALWVRDGIGHTTAATVEHALDALGLAVLRLDPPIDGAATALAPRDPFAGSPGFAIDFAAGPAAEPQWPWLQAGFFGSLVGSASAPAGDGQRRLGIGVAPASLGAAVFDASGRWAGLALPGRDGTPRWLTPSLLRAALPAALPAPADTAEAAAPRVGADLVYERALRQVVQLIAAP